MMMNMAPDLLTSLTEPAISNYQKLPRSVWWPITVSQLADNCEPAGRYISANWLTVIGHQIHR